LHVYMFFFSSRRRHTRSKRDWSSDVCSSDLGFAEGHEGGRMSKIFYILTIISMVVGACVSAFMFLTALLMSPGLGALSMLLSARSEERRVGKDCRCMLGW